MYTVLTDGTHEEVKTYNWGVNPYTLPLSGHWITQREKYGRREHWYSEPMFIDTETSHLGEEEGWIHQWAIAWCGFNVIGRRAEELIYFLVSVNNMIKDWAKMKGYNPKNWKILGYIHNMGYDMEYMRQFFPDQEPEFFAVKPHRILTAKWDRLEIRCSYLLTQKPLAKWAEDSKARHPKLEGTYDYNVVRTPSSPMSDTEWSYQLNDVASMRDSWFNDREHDGYNACTIPLTSTGFVRADCRESAKSNPYWKIQLNAMQPDIEVYNALEMAFAGGETHGNRFYKEQIVQGPIGHRDFASSYPARQCINAFPMGKFVSCNIKTLDDVFNLMQSQALLIHIALHDPELKTRKITAPYLSFSKCRPWGRINELLDNGRVISIKGDVSLWVTEYDLVILSRQYKLTYQILQAYSAPKGKLPVWFRDKIMEYYKNKTTLKYEDSSNYMRSKAKLNGIYGMTAERNVRDELEYDDGEWVEKKLAPEERDNALQKHIRKDNTQWPFAWGVWTTALARYALNQCIELVGYDKFLYCDTDSIFYIMDEETEQKMDEYNEYITGRAKKAGAYVNYKGQDYCLGEFTPEDDMPIRRFTHVHAKCYALEDKNGKLHVTVAGVTKKQRTDPSKTNADELGSIENLKQGFIFRECGGTRIVYNNKHLHHITVNGEDILVGASAVICNTEYQVSDADNMDMDDLEMANIILGVCRSDIYGDYVGLK